jgi:hypothetical protein
MNKKWRTNGLDRAELNKLAAVRKFGLDSGYTFYGPTRTRAEPRLTQAEPRLTRAEPKARPDVQPYVDGQ